MGLACSTIFNFSNFSYFKNDFKEILLVRIRLYFSLVLQLFFYTFSTFKDDCKEVIGPPIFFTGPPTFLTVFTISKTIGSFIGPPIFFTGPLFFHQSWIDDQQASQSGSMVYPLDHRPEFNGLMQERHNSIANALELHFSCTNPSIWFMATAP